MTSQNLSENAKSYMKNKLTGRMSALQESINQQTESLPDESPSPMTPARVGLPSSGASTKKKTTKKPTKAAKSSLAVSG